MKNVKAIISDADGTLVNTVDLIRHGQYEAAKRFYIRNGVAENDIPDFTYYIECLDRVVGASAHDTLRKTAELIFQDRPEYLGAMNFDELTASLKSVQDEMAPSYVRPYGGLKDFLNNLGQNDIRFAIFTSGSRYEVTRNFGIALPELSLTELYKDESMDDSTKLNLLIDTMSNKFQLADFTIVTFEDTERHKPNPDSLQLAMERLGVEPLEVMVMGDHAVDMLSAESAGVELRFGLTHGFHEEQALRESGATHIGHSLADVESYVL